MPRRIDHLVIHCSASPNGDSLFRGKLGQADYRAPVDLIDEWHQARGFRRDYGARVRFNPNLQAIGYHYVIYTNGAIVAGRHPDEIGAHARGHNAHSLGICMVGTSQFTAAQWDSLADLVALLLKGHSGANVLGHRDFSGAHKSCPCFDVGAWLAGGMRSPA